MTHLEGGEEEPHVDRDPGRDREHADDLTGQEAAPSAVEEAVILAPAIRLLDVLLAGVMGGKRASSQTCVASLTANSRP